MSRERFDLPLGAPALQNIDVRSAWSVLFEIVCGRVALTFLQGDGSELTETSSAWLVRCMWVIHMEHDNWPLQRPTGMYVEAIEGW